LLKAVLWLIRKALLVGPCAIIAVWGYSYLKLCFLILLAPNRPILLKYVARGGSVIVRASSYSIDPAHGVVTLWNLKIHAPGGGVVASAKRIVVSNLNISRGASQNPVIDVDMVTGTLERFKNGNFQVVDLLPSTQSKGTSTAPYRVTIHKANIVLEDLVGDPWEQRVQTSLIEVEGSGASWVAHAEANLPGMGSGFASIENAAGVGLRVTGRTESVDGTQLVRHLLKDRKLHFLDRFRALNFGKLIASGPFEVFVPPDHRFSFKSHVHASARDVSLGDYRAEAVSFIGVVGNEGVAGKAMATVGGNKAIGMGSLSFKTPIQAGFRLTASSPSQDSLPSKIKHFLPTGITFDEAKFSGWATYRPDNKWAIQGSGAVERVTYRNETATQSQVAIFASPNRIRVDVQRTLIAGASPVGAVVVDPIHKTVTGYGKAGNLLLADVGRLTHTQGMAGTGSVQAIFSGSIGKPQIIFRAAGDGSYRREKIALGPDRVEAEGTFKDNSFFIKRGLINGRDGLVAVSGRSSEQGDQIDLQVEGRNFSLEKYVEGLTGSVSLSAKVTGDYRDPVATGMVRGVNLSYQGQTVSAAVADFVADRRKVVATRVGAVSGAMDLQGDVSYGFKGSRLKGKFELTGLELAQFLGDEAAGIVDVPTIQINGTLKNPQIVARVDGSHLVVGNVLIDSAEAFISANEKSATIDHATANFAGGSISATGGYDFADKIGNAVATSTAFDLGQLAPAFGQTITLKGSGSIQEAKISYKDGKFAGSASGELSSISANGAPVGDGNWTANATGDTVGGTLSIGQVEPELRVVDLQGVYNYKLKTLSGTFDADRSHLSDILSASLRYLPGNWATPSSPLLDITGDLTVGAKFTGPISSPDVSVDTLQVNNIQYKKASFGDLTASNIARENSKWTVPQISLKGPEGVVAGSGTFAENGPIAATLTGTGLKASAFSIFSPALASSRAEANFSVEASGEARKPSLLGRIDLTHLVDAPAWESSKKVDQDLSVDVPNIRLSTGVLSLNGSYTFGGFSGNFDGSAPFSFQNAFGDESIHAHVSLAKRQLKELPFVDQFIDPIRSQGSMSGDLTATGPLKDLEFGGGMEFSAQTLGLRFSNPDAYLKKIDDQFKSVLVKLSITPDRQIQVAGSATAVPGGVISLSAETAIPDFGDLGNEDIATFKKRILNNLLTGSLDLKNLAFQQSVPGGFISAVVNGKTLFGGTLEKPEIGTPSTPGMFTFRGVDTTIPTFRAGSESATPPGINPSFNLMASLDGPAHIKSATAEVNLTGSGTLKGTLSDPAAKSTLFVDSGTVHLPGGTVRLVPGGTLNFAYLRSFPQGSIASLDVDLQGKTAITAIRYGQTTQRYDITLDITGDVLQDNGLHFDAISDPPDLTADDVLDLLGEKNLLESLGSADQSEAEQRVRDALVGFALPSLLDPYTSTLAHNLGLDYVSLEYNSVNLATLDTARSVSPELTFQYRQQVGTPPPGYRSIYDLRLVYSPKKGPQLLRRLSLSVGTDQDRPWKVALEYGVRFGGYLGPPVKNKTVISSPSKP
jgi:hypothetical protein